MGLDGTILDIEAFEHDITKYVYRGLERHTSAPSQSVRPKGTIPQRGPVYRNSSSALDSAIVAGMLLDAGCTELDRANEQEEQFTKAERAFIDATNLDWDAYTEDESAYQRDRFWRALENAKPRLGIEVGKAQHVWGYWIPCTESFAQFRFFHSDTYPPHSCTKNPEWEVHESNETAIQPDDWDGDETGVTMQELVSRYFRPLCQCALCGCVGSTRSISSPPMRMTVMPDEAARIRKHTGILTFPYSDLNGQLHEAKYRWLGGIYAQRNGRHRVYWNPTQHGEQDTGRLWMYDSSMNSGRIVDETILAGADPDDRVPPEWHRDVSVPLLFYERVLDEESELLCSARAYVNATISAIHEWGPYYHYPYRDWMVEQLQLQVQVHVHEKAPQCETQEQLRALMLLERFRQSELVVLETEIQSRVAADLGAAALFDQLVDNERVGEATGIQGLSVPALPEDSSRPWLTLVGILAGGIVFCGGEGWQKSVQRGVVNVDVERMALA